MFFVSSTLHGLELYYPSAILAASTPLNDPLSLTLGLKLLCYHTKVIKNKNTYKLSNDRCFGTQ